MFDYSLLDWIDKKNEKISLLIKIYKNFHLEDYIDRSILCSVLDMKYDNRLLDNHYDAAQYDLMREIVKDFQEIYINFGKIILKAKGAYSGSEPISLFEISCLLDDLKENYLENLYWILDYDSSYTLAQSVHTHICFYSLIKRECMEVDDII